MSRKWTLLFISLLLLNGCSNNDNPEVKIFQQNGEEAKIEQEIKTLDAVTNTIVYKQNDKLLVAFKVKQFEKFFLKKHEQEIKEMLRRKYPKYKTIVSSDLKIYLEAEKLKEKRSKNKTDKNEMKKQFNEIINLSKEQT